MRFIDTRVTSKECSSKYMKSKRKERTQYLLNKMAYFKRKE